MQVTSEVTAQQIADLFITAVEGGVAYWCKSMYFFNGKAPADYKEAATFDNDGWKVMVIPHENPDGRTQYEITPETLAFALRMQPKRLAEVIEEEGDADTADLLVQQAAFGEVVFG